ncbi:MAG: 4-hydroxythreonine-4-phosphate dehydrogenase PdxA [Bacteroidetes bacterium]|nr:MAG: 4-hydroxythreonine-4-phosphate dehydrogenase PdxA [Bacteroidota bacterium]
MNPRLRIGITLGDVNGIGPELVIKLFQESYIREMCTPILYGSLRALNIYRKVLNIERLPHTVIQHVNQAQPRRLNVIECYPELERVDIGKPSEIGGRSAYLALKRAIEDAQHQELDALVTLPVDKASMQQQDPGFIGHTELLAEAFNVPDDLMLMVHDDLRVGLITNHLAISEVSRNLTVQQIVNKAHILHDTLELDFDIPRPLIALLALNPHAGDRGLMGDEEQEIIAKALDELKEDGLMVSGPYPADGFFGSLTYKKFHATLAMYHDQGLIPFKLLAGYEGVNVTAGLPIVRTSPDHGVAYDIAGQGIADENSFRQALYLAINLCRTRAENEPLRANALDLSDELERKKG